MTANPTRCNNGSQGKRRPSCATGSQAREDNGRHCRGRGRHRRLDVHHASASLSRRKAEERRQEMKRQALFFSACTAAMLTWPAFAADGVSGMIGARWGKNAFNFEPMPSGPQPLRNLSRRPDGTGNAGQLVGDYHNPILKPEAAAAVRQKGELAIAGKGFPNAQDQCRPIAPPFTFARQLGFAMLPARDGNIAIVYDQNANVRHIRMNAAHPAKLVPSPMGDSVGHWEGDTLVIDTVGVKVDRFTSV